MTDWKGHLGMVKNRLQPDKGSPGSGSTSGSGSGSVTGMGIRNKVKGFIAQGDSTSDIHSSDNHAAAPISTLRDPYSFGPPPKRVGSGTQSPASASQPYQSPARQIEAPPAESRPYRQDTTGLSTSHLPPPPPRRDSPDRRDAAPPPYSPMRTAGPPSLPPRLPPRSGNASPVQRQSPVSTGNSQPSYLNQGAINRLGAAGISVPGLGIGSKTPPTPPARSPGSASPTKTSGSGHLSELQGRFSRFSTNSSPQEPAGAPKEGTTWAEKRAALKTAANLKKDPSSVSFADAKSFAGTAHNFQQRHGDKIASGMKAANGLGQRLGVVEKSNGQTGQAAPTSPMGQITGFIGKKKPPPPPPAKKPQLSGAGTPPPVPTATRPR